MRTKMIIVAGMACAALVLSGCKKDESVSDTQAPKSSDTAPVDAKATTATGAVAAAATDAVNQAQGQVNAAQQDAQGLIDKAKNLVAENKYQDALASLNQLAGAKLSTEQQQMVDGLKTQIQAALAKATSGNAASALGNALGGAK